MKKIYVRMATVAILIMTVALGALTATSLCAQTAYTLEQCRDMALYNNVKSRNADNSLKAARQGRASAFTNYFPTISATGMGNDANKGLLQMEMGPEMSMSLLVISMRRRGTTFRMPTSRCK